MKFRTDFVTNSSSSSFIVTINIETTKGNLTFYGNGGTPESGRVDYFEGDAIITASPKKMCLAESVEEMIEILTDGVLDGYEYEPEFAEKIFAQSNPVEVFDFEFDDFDEEMEFPTKTVDAYEFIEKIRNTISDMDEVISVSVEGVEENYILYEQAYKYDKRTGKYEGHIRGYEFEKDGASGGIVSMPDWKECEITQTDE